MDMYFRVALKWHLRLSIVLLFAGAIHAQTTLALSSATATGESVSLELSLNSSAGVTPAAIQWSLHYSPRAVRAITVEDGPALGPVAKTVLCGGEAGAFTCMAVGYNAELIPDGVVARVNVALAPGEKAADIAITDALGASILGYPIAIIATGGTATAGPNTSPPVPVRRRRGDQ
jgi:hypothetical protein